MLHFIPAATPLSAHCNRCIAPADVLEVVTVHAPQAVRRPLQLLALVLVHIRVAVLAVRAAGPHDAGVGVRVVHLHVGRVQSEWPCDSAAAPVVRHAQVPVAAAHKRVLEDQQIRSAKHQVCMAGALRSHNMPACSSLVFLVPQKRRLPLVGHATEACAS